MLENDIQLTDRDIVTAENMTGENIRIVLNDIRVRLESAKKRKGVRTLFRQNATSRSVVRLFNIMGWKCVYCGVPLEFALDGSERIPYSLTLEHVVPIRKGGSNGVSNIVCACLYCNSLKANFDLEQFCATQNYNYDAVRTRLNDFYQTYLNTLDE